MSITSHVYYIDPAGVYNKFFLWGGRYIIDDDNVLKVSYL
jgi:hypothetical protein